MNFDIKTEPLDGAAYDIAPSGEFARYTPPELKQQLLELGCGVEVDLARESDDVGVPVEPIRLDVEVHGSPCPWPASTLAALLRQRVRLQLLLEELDLLFDLVRARIVRS